MLKAPSGSGEGKSATNFAKTIVKRKGFHGQTGRIYALELGEGRTKGKEEWWCS